MNIRLKQLLVFKAIAETGTVSEAARHLHLTQSSVSKLLAGFEDELDFMLFDRSGRRLELSPQGEQFFRRIESAIDVVEDIQTVAEDIRDNEGQRLRLCAIGPLLHSDMIPQAIVRFTAQYPEYNFSVDMQTRLKMEGHIVSRRSDIGFTLLPVDTTKLNSEKVISVRAYAAVPNHHRLAQADSLSPTDLQYEYLVMPDSQAWIRGIVESCFVQAGIQLRPRTETASVINAIHLVSHGMGIGIADPFSMTGVDRTRFQVIPWQPVTNMTFGLVWPKSRMLTDHEKVFLTLARQVAGETIRNFQAQNVPLKLSELRKEMS